MKLKLVRIVLFGLLASAAFAQDQTLRDSVPSIDVLRNRLHLTAEQEARLTPLLRQREQQLQETRSKLDMTSSNTGKRDLMRTAKSDAQSFNSQVESLLDASQRSEWRELRDETREKVKERYERQQESRP